MNKNERVVLLHGIGLSRWSLWLTQKRIERAGYRVLSISYPSTQKSLDEIAGWLRQEYLTEQFWNDANKIHFVTHSMGGLVIRRYLDKFKEILPLQKVGRVVMMAPPNQGSEAADLFHQFPPYGWLFGPAGLELPTHIQEKNTDIPFYEVGIIAGSSSWLYPFSRIIIPRPNDGRVAVERTKLELSKDHLTIPTSHTFMIYRKSVHNQIISFLNHGAFQHDV